MSAFDIKEFLPQLSNVIKSFGKKPVAFSVGIKYITADPLKRQQNNCIWKCLLNISTDANIVDPDQTAPTGSGSTLLIYEASNSLVDDKDIHFVIMRFKG